MNPDQFSKPPQGPYRPAVPPGAPPSPIESARVPNGPTNIYTLVIETPVSAASSIPIDKEPVNKEPVYPEAVRPSPDTKPPKPKKFRSGFKSVISTTLLFLMAPVIALSLTAFAFQSYQVDGQSMETTLQDRDRLIVNKSARTWSRITNHAYIPKRGEIVIFNQAGLFDAGGGQEKQLIKRVIGLPGERVVVKDGKITIYNKAHPDGYDPDRSGLYRITATTTPGNSDVTLQDDEIFVCGDNRTNSEDSRYFGPVNADRLVGKLSFRLLPISKAQRF